MFFWNNVKIGQLLIKTSENIHSEINHTCVRYNGSMLTNDCINKWPKFTTNEKHLIHVYNRLMSVSDCINNSRQLTSGSYSLQANLISDCNSTRIIRTQLSPLRLTSCKKIATCEILDKEPIVIVGVYTALMSTPLAAAMVIGSVTIYVHM